MDAFTRGYLECAIWTATDDAGNSLDHLGYIFDDFAPEAIAQAEKECRDFQETNADLLRQFQAITGQDADYCGHDFSLTRNGHGTGFWDRGAGQVGDQLTAACKPYGEVSVYVGNDNRLYFG
jgi:hypothetical protein